MITRFADALNMCVDQKEDLFRIVRRQKFVHRENAGARRLAADEYALVADLDCYGLLMLMGTEGFSSDINWMAERLGVTTTRVRSILEKLERLQLIRRRGDEYQRVQSRVTTTHETPSEILKESHMNVLKHAMDSIYNVDLSLREITSITVPLDPTKINQAKNEIRNFRRRMAKLVSSGHPSEVYNLNIQLVPMTKGASK